MPDPYEDERLRYLHDPRRVVTREIIERSWENGGWPKYFAGDWPGVLADRILKAIDKLEDPMPPDPDPSTVPGKQPSRPKCPCCGHRHTVGMAVAYYDTDDDLWRCARCHRPINADGECRGDDCCGWVPRARSKTIMRPDVKSAHAT